MEELPQRFEREELEEQQGLQGGQALLEQQRFTGSEPFWL